MGLRSFPPFELMRFAQACEEFLDFKKQHGELTPEEEEALEPYIEKLQSLVEERNRATPD